MSYRILLIVTPADAISDALAYAIEREFPSIIVEQVPVLEAACVQFKHPVSLILVDTLFLRELEAHASDLARVHATAPVALIQGDSRTPVSVHEIVASKTVRGVLPMDLKLDLWLSVVRLMLRGGEYFPFAMFQPYFRDASFPRETVEPERTLQPVPARSDDFDELQELTEREFQILEMVARGLQNKIIAASLCLSEYTVKIHLHHIITKLRAHNRTEAAAIFHERRGTFQRTALDARAGRLPASML